MKQKELHHKNKKWCITILFLFLGEKLTCTVTVVLLFYYQQLVTRS